MAQASMVNGQTINNRSAGVAADGGNESAWSDLRSMVTTRFDDIPLSPLTDLSSLSSSNRTDSSMRERGKGSCVQRSGSTVTEFSEEIGRSERTVQRVLERLKAELLRRCESEN